MKSVLKTSSSVITNMRTDIERAMFNATDRNMSSNIFILRLRLYNFTYIIFKLYVEERYSFVTCCFVFRILYLSLIGACYLILLFTELVNVTNRFMNTSILH